MLPCCLVKSGVGKTYAMVGEMWCGEREKEMKYCSIRKIVI